MKFFSVFIFAFFFANSVYSQSYIPMVQEGYYWDICYADMGYICGGSGAAGPYRCGFVGDTLIGGNHFKWTKRYNSHSLSGTPPFSNCPPFVYDTTFSILPNYVFRDDTTAKQVISYNLSTQIIDTIFDFSLNKGDTFQFNTGKFPVDTVFYITTPDGISRKALASYHSCNFPDEIPCIVEGIGSQNGFFFAPLPMFFEQGNYLMCFKDSISNIIVSNHYFNSIQNNCFPFITSLRNLGSSSSPSLSYSSNNSSITIKPFPLKGKLAIYNLSGILLSLQETKKTISEYQVQKLDRSIYIITLQNENGEIYCKKEISIQD